MGDGRRTTPTLAALRQHRDDIMALASRYGVTNVRVFGSVARGEATTASDVDLLVDLPSGFSLLALSGLVQGLQQLVGFPVQVTNAAHLREELRPSILRDVQLL